MNKIKRINFVCTSVLKVAFFYALLVWWGYQVDPLVAELYVNTPFVLFACVVFFLFLFFSRTMGCLVFMPKYRLKAILHDGELTPTASQIVIRLFSLPFIKRVFMYFFLFAGEFILRLLFIPLFLRTVGATIPFWARLSMHSVFLVNSLLFITAYIFLELPSYLLFYKLSLKGRSNRQPEYRFGLKLSALTIILLGLYFVFLPLSLRLSETNGEALSVGMLTVSGVGLWYLMYRKKWACYTENCPICSKFKSFFVKACRRREEERAELKKSYADAETLAETIIEAEAREVAPPEEEKTE